MHGYVLKRSNGAIEVPHVALGKDSNVIIAVDQGGVIGAVKCDSRLFQAIAENEIKFVTSVLKEFVDDAPTGSPVVGGFVRPRAHCEIYSYKMSSSFIGSDEKFLEPLIVLAVNDEKLIVGGFSCKSTLIHEVETYTNMVCAM